jgi:hypothetical protein
MNWLLLPPLAAYLGKTFRPAINPHVLSPCYRHKMGWIHALSILAKVMKIRPFGLGSELGFIHDDMGHAGFAAYLDPPISTSRETRPLPIPAAGIGIFNVLRSGWARVVPADEVIWLAANSTAPAIGHGNQGCSLTTSALTESKGNIWSRIAMHFWSLLKRFRGAMAGDVDASPGLSLPQLYPFSSEVVG